MAGKAFHGPGWEPDSWSDASAWADWAYVSTATNQCLTQLLHELAHEDRADGSVIGRIRWQARAELVEAGLHRRER